MTNKPASGGTYLVYIDDSGDETVDVLAALAIPTHSWAPTIGYWKTFRRMMKRQWAIPPSVEFHSVEILGRGTHRTVTDSVIDPATISAEQPQGTPFVYSYPKQITLADGHTVTREDLFVSAVTRVAEMNDQSRDFGIRLITLTSPVPEGSGALYHTMLERLDEWLNDGDAYAIVWSDGTAEAKEQTLRGMHRNLDLRSRRILEDATCRDSKHSHFLQMADVCAHAAFRALQAGAGLETRRRVAQAYTRLHDLVIEHPSNDATGISHIDPPENE